MGMFLYDNTGFVGNPLNPFFTNEPAAISSRACW
jgi:hypothetical protein